MKTASLRLSKLIFLSISLSFGIATAQEVREACATSLHTATYATQASARKSAILEFESKNCVKDIFEAFGSTGVPKPSSRSAMAIMAMAFVTSKVTANLVDENARLVEEANRLRAEKATATRLLSGGLASGSAHFRVLGDTSRFSPGTVYQFENTTGPNGPGAVFKEIPRDRLKP